MKDTNQKMVMRDKVHRLKIQQLQEEKEAEHRRAEELKELVLTRLAALEEKIQGSTVEEKNSFL